jgi:guanylate kinase
VIESLYRSRGRVFVVSGPSGVGKGAVIRALLSRPGSEKLHRAITATTRPKRDGETDGIDRFFYTEPEFVQRIEAGFFLEHVRYVDYRYGTPREQVAPHLDSGLDVVLEIEVEGGLRVRDAEDGVVLVFVAPPSIDVLERRLRGRGDLAEEQIVRRLRRAEEEMRTAARYDYLIINQEHRLEDAADQLAAIVTAERRRIWSAPDAPGTSAHPCPPP